MVERIETGTLLIAAELDPGLNPALDDVDLDAGLVTEVGGRYVGKKW
jgi:hypothetical protein